MTKRDPEDETFDPQKHDETHHGHPVNQDEFNESLISKDWGQEKTTRS